MNNLKHVLFLLSILLSYSYASNAEELRNDADTQLLQHFNSDALGEAGEMPTSNTASTYPVSNREQESEIYTCQFPSNINADLIGGKVARLNWTSINEATRYKIQYRIQGGSWTEKLTATIETFRFLNGLSPNSSYEYRIKSLCPSGNSTWSQIYEFETLNDLCDIPSIVLFIYYPSNSKLVQWVGFPDDLKYRYKYKPAGGSWIESTTTSTTQIINGLSPGVEYVFKIKTKCSGSWTNWSNDYTFTSNVQTNPNFRFTDESIYPNPAGNILNINYYSSVNSKMTFEIFDILGKRVMSEIVNSTKGINWAELDVAHLQTGNHYIKIQSGEETVIRSFVKL